MKENLFSFYTFAKKVSLKYRKKQSYEFIKK